MIFPAYDLCNLDLDYLSNELKLEHIMYLFCPTNLRKRCDEARALFV